MIFVYRIHQYPIRPVLLESQSATPSISTFTLSPELPMTPSGRVQVLVAHKLHTQRIVHDGQNDRFSWFLALAHRAIFPLDMLVKSSEHQMLTSRMPKIHWSSGVKCRNNMINLETSNATPLGVTLLNWPCLLDRETFHLYISFSHHSSILNL